MADVHGLGHVRGTEVDDNGAGRGGFFEKEVSAAIGGFECFLDGGGFEAEIEKTGSGNFDFFTKICGIETCQDVRGQLTRVHFAFFGQGHERGGLIIAEFWIRAGADLKGSGIRFGPDGPDSLTQPLFQYFMQHGR